jgi:Uma2 family endonuclease/predicted RNase H-like HicB family nuclease
MVNWDVVLQRTDKGYSAWCPGLPGGWSEAHTEEQAVANLAGAIEKYVAPLAAAGLRCHLRRLNAGRQGVELDVQPAGGRWTYEEFAKLPDEHRERWEIMSGELSLSPRSTPLHQTVLSDLTIALYQFAEKEHHLGTVFIGPVDVLFAVGDFMAPDALFVRRDRKEIITERAIEGGSPDLVVEITLEATAERDRGIKRERYAHYGVPEYWIVDPEQRSVEIHRVRDGLVLPPVLATETFSWQPVQDGPTLILSVPELLEDYDELREIIESNERKRSMA